MNNSNKSNNKSLEALVENLTQKIDVLEGRLIMIETKFENKFLEIGSMLQKLNEKISSNEDRLSEITKYILSSKEIRESNLQIRECEEQKQESELVSVGECSNKDRLEDLISKIKVDIKDDLLSVQTISQIYESLVICAGNDFRTELKAHREKRRKFTHDLNKYAELCKEYNKKVTEIVEKAKSQILSHLNIEKTLLKKSSDYYLANGDYEVLMLEASIFQNLKKVAPRGKDLDDQLMKKILETRIKALQVEEEKFKQLKKDKNLSQEINTVVQNIVDDLIYEQFQVEEEDVNAYLEKNIQNLEIQSLLMEYQQEIMRATDTDNFY